MAKKQALKQTIGRAESVDLPDIGLNGLEAKVDTGAYSCSIHCHSVEKIEREGKEFIRVTFIHPSDKSKKEKVIIFDTFSVKRIKNSFGHSEKRFMIKTNLEIFGKKYLTEFSLSNRENLRFPLLVGRKFLKARFVVDVSKYNQSLKFIKRKKKYNL
ncbi:MAG: peptidase [Bacteroidetes bacterium]|nr:peptidase [Bacteroidota bacterium]MBV6461979.1 hypothetical protein [Flavobacteriales bacterium]WKZ76627.1 MAG: RimK/LysX family protein [Vicingaceae bacterium]MCL4815552.1 RimK/LysX family protein [Flavobacteriales bacterium]NOG94309.1 peptidase [Bacteroidota bacterium]